MIICDASVIFNISKERKKKIMSIKCMVMNFTIISLIGKLDMADENPASEHINSKDRSFMHNP